MGDHGGYVHDPTCPSCSATEEMSTMQKDLRRILYELGISNHARPDSPHDVVMREVLPRIRELRAAGTVSVDPGPHAHEWIEDLDRCAIEGCHAVHPSKVRVGDVVQVEADDGSWMVRGEVTDITRSRLPEPFMIVAGGRAIRPTLHGATVRVLRRAVPEPDPWQADKLHDLICAIRPNEDTESALPLARELVRRGVRVDGGPDDG